MNKSDRPLYENRFFSIGAFLNGPIFQFVIGTILSAIGGYLLHWSVGLIIFAFAVIISAASYFVFKK